MLCTGKGEHWELRLQRPQPCRVGESSRGKYSKFSHRYLNGGSTGFLGRLIMQREHVVLTRFLRALVSNSGLATSLSRRMRSHPLNRLSAQICIRDVRTQCRPSVFQQEAWTQCRKLLVSFKKDAM